MSGYFTRMAALAVTHPKRSGGSGFRAAGSGMADIRETTVAAPTAPAASAGQVSAARPATTSAAPIRKAGPEPAREAVTETSAKIGPPERVVQGPPVSADPVSRREPLLSTRAVEEPAGPERTRTLESVAPPDNPGVNKGVVTSRRPGPLVERAETVEHRVLPRDGASASKPVEAGKIPEPGSVHQNVAVARESGPRRTAANGAVEAPVTPAAGQAMETAVPSRPRSGAVREQSAPEVPRPPRRVSVSIGEVSLSVEPPAAPAPKPEPVAPPPRPTAPSRPAAGGIWTGGQGLSRSYVRRL